MLFRAVLAALAGLAATVFAQNGTNATACHDYVLIVVRGTFELPGPSIAFMNVTALTLERMPNGTVYNLPYPATFQPDSTPTGASNLESYLTTQHAACPAQKYALLGYSQGAAVINLALDLHYTKPSPIKHLIRGVLVVGNPMRVPFKPANIDQYGGNLTSNLMGSDVFFGIRIPDVWYKSLRVLDICHTNDVFCAGFPSNTSANTLVAHLQYGSTPQVQLNGASFLLASLMSYIGE